MGKNKKFNVAEHLETPEDIRAFLEEVIATGNDNDLLHAVKTATRAIDIMEGVEKGYLGVSLEDFLKDQGLHKNIMKNPAHPRAIIKDSLDEVGLSVAQGAKALGVSHAQLDEIISGNSSVSPEMAMRLEKVLGSKAEMWLRLQNSYDLAQVREKVLGLGLKKVSVKHPDL